MTEIGGNSRSTDDIVTGQFIHDGAQLEQHGEWLADAPAGAEDGNFGFGSSSRHGTTTQDSSCRSREKRRSEHFNETVKWIKNEDEKDQTSQTEAYRECEPTTRKDSRRRLDTIHMGGHASRGAASLRVAAA